MRACVDVFDDGVFFAFLKVARSPDDAVNVVFIVAILTDEALGELPINFKFRLVEGGDELGVGSTVNLVDRGVINAGPFGEVVGFVG